MRNYDVSTDMNSQALSCLANSLTGVHIVTCAKPQGKSVANKYETISEYHISTILFKKYPFTSRKKQFNVSTIQFDFDA